MNLLDKAMEEGYEEVIQHTPMVDKPVKKNPLFRSHPGEDKIDLQFEVWFKDASFKLGYVVFDKNIPVLKHLVRFKIENDFLLPEFDLIKSYFMKALGKRKFDVDATIYMENHKVSTTKASSTVISKINESLIDSIKYIRTIGLTHTPVKVNVDHNLFTSEDIFESLDDEDMQGNVFNQSEEEILRYILEKAKVRNRRIEDAINQVRNSGRENYKSAYRNSHVDQDLLFNVIHHQDVNSPFIEGFVKWKHRVNELLV